MIYGDLVARVDFNMTRESAFSYRCNACKRCCRNKAIRVNPYEILRLARRLGLSTTDFIARHTEAGGTVLRSRDDGNCGFLGEHGCSVHSDRPLACRLYPLARWVSPEGEESFGHLAPHPHSEGVYGAAATVEAYLDQQDVAPLFAMSERYGALYARMLEALETIDPLEIERKPERRTAVDEQPAGSVASSWLDIDGTLADEPPLDDLAMAVSRHIEAIEACIEQLRREAGAAGQPQPISGTTGP